MHVSLDQNIDGVILSETIIRKPNIRLTYIQSPAKLLYMESREKLATVLVQKKIDDAFCIWHSKLQKQTKLKLQIIQNKFVIDLPS